MGAVRGKWWGRSLEIPATADDYRRMFDLKASWKIEDLKMAYHLSEDARTGLLEFNIPRVLKDRLFEYQVAAVNSGTYRLFKAVIRA